MKRVKWETWRDREWFVCVCVCMCLYLQQRTCIQNTNLYNNKRAQSKNEQNEIVKWAVFKRGYPNG